MSPSEAKRVKACLERARSDAERWAEAYGSEFRATMGSYMSGARITLPDGEFVHRSHLNYMRARGLVEFDSYGAEFVIRVT